MKGSEIVAALNGIINTTCLKDLTPEDKATVRCLLRAHKLVSMLSSRLRFE